MCVSWTHVDGSLQVAHEVVAVAHARREAEQVVDRNVALPNQGGCVVSQRTSTDRGAVVMVRTEVGQVERAERVGACERGGGGS